MIHILKYITAVAAVLLLLFAGFFMMVQRSCSPTWFKPAGVHVLPVGLDLSTGRVDTSGQYPASTIAGFALHIVPEYVMQAAIEPGILGIIDTLTHFAVEAPDGSGGWVDVSTQFFYGLPQGCAMLAPGGFQRGTNTVKWYSDWPDSTHTRTEIHAFTLRFNHTWLSGLEVAGAVFTFWLKPESNYNRANSLHFRVRIETQDGKKWVERIDINRVLSPSECREFLKKITDNDSITLLYDSCAPTYRHFIFIDHNPRAKFYKQLSNFTFQQSDQADYDDFLQKQANHTPVSLPSDLPRNWVMVHRYKNRLYAYYPSDFGNHFRVQLNENAFIGYQMDGLELDKLKAVDRTEDNAWDILLASGKQIRLTRTAPGNPVWRWKFSNWECLMVSAESLRELPIIVNYCEERKQKEFDFEQ